MQKVDTPLMERYIFTCVSCGWDRQFFGTAKESRESADRMGWEFRKAMRILPISLDRSAPDHEWIEKPYCPHCRLLVKEPA